MGMKQVLTNWNGKSVDEIGEVYGRYASTHSFIAQLVQFMSQKPLQKGASWLLKHHFEEGQKLILIEIKQIYQLLPELVHWESKLHILQCIPFMPIEVSQAAQVHEFLHVCVSDKNKLVRAWAYNGFYELAVQHKAYKTEAKQRLEAAMTDEAASVKARIRNVMKKGGL